MLFIKRMATAFQICITLLPAGMSLYAVGARSLPMALLSVAAIFTIVAILPICRQRESIWVFFILFMTVTPINITVIIKVLSSWLFDGSLLITNILRGGLFYLISLSIEELACGFVARLIWRRQCKAILVHIV